MVATRISKMLTRCLGAMVVALAGAGSVVAADAFPTRPVRIVVNTAPGGLVDVTTRLVAEKLRATLGQQVIVDNRAGADGLLGIRAVKDAPADGYTLLASAGTIAIQPAIRQDAGYELAKDFAGIAPLIRSPLLMVVGPSQPEKTVTEFIAKAKANPGAVSYASAGVGTTTHVGAALFLQQAGLNLMHVPYKGNAAAMPDVIGGRVTSTTRIASLPEVPTIAEQGLPGYSYYLWIGLVAPAGTPKDVVQRLSQAVRAAVTTPELKERFRSEGSEPMEMSPEEFNDFMKRDSARMAKLVNDLGLQKQ